MAVGSVTEKPFRTSLAIQGRVIWALLMREVLTRYGRHNIGFLWLFVEPMMFTLGVTAIWTATKSVHGSDLPIVAFAITGYSSVLLWRNMPARCIDAIEPNRSLLFHRNVRVLDIFLSRILLEAAGATSSLLVLAAFFIAIGQMSQPEDILQVIGGWLMLAWFGAALAIFLGAASEKSEIVHKLWHPVSYLMFPLSGAAFLLSALPPQAQAILKYLPMINGVEYLREGFFGSKIHAIYDMGYMATCNMVLTVLGLCILRVVADEVIPE
ncbi:capsule polysaccharide export inner-membrane protein [Novosphingobium sp. Rr 2-17]|uniref:ABC transporter permease n=1 Tax=Novosphingobium sp. Rr 2-17 TaxID=555793 RepID=UPI000269ABDF|nr:ABC transporter permease [Novosphingobium sp. Rr 2-17]EIZ77176.1 capsule polysaccharide export inner-membrane protein [Novosphingobium sp. Rr 2-17]